MELRDFERADSERVHEVARSSMTTSYALSPQQIDAIADERFSEDGFERVSDDDDVTAFVAEEDGTVVGVVEGRLDGTEGEIRWLFVDPEVRGGGIGTQLFERMAESLRDRGARHLVATTLEANAEGSQFFEHFDFERTDERQVEIADQSLVEYVYAESSAAEETNDSEAGDDSNATDFPGTETSEAGTTATTEDGERVYLDREDERSGTKAPFLPAYSDGDRDEQFGYYCGSCGSLDTAMDNVERIECGDCGNVHAERSSEEYDDSYL